ncbi:Ger(x)C family spore germination protein [Halalkalibacter akibai]|uniref:Spore germination protein n=1 Tax=Halalkalibacter akibai (strain ATCC 43226 / DSM 21942 / CIP 109018 / JCM 9157 / 1139) TaxID=1236973 RepID=W4R020_HALA3|nr:Ger(x)C family spore germination protein [Halalkalibacter akibai]GAE37487.1 spore germination protein [Halalkalibacter akibai JCM 9157]
MFSFVFLFYRGCWDLNEIEEISFVIGTAFDPASEMDRDEYRKETGRQLPKGMFKMTNQVVIPGEIESGGEGGSSNEGPFFNISSMGMTSFKTNRNFTTRRSRPMNYEHLKIIIINEELAREGIMDHLLDFFARDHEMRRDMLVLISEGQGYDILEKKLPLEMMPAMSIEMISENAPRGHGIPQEKYIGELITDVLSGQSYIVPRIVDKEGDDFKVAGAAIFLGSNNKMIGLLGEYDIQGYGWVTGEMENEALEAYYGENEIPFVYENDFTQVNVDYSHIEGRDVFNLEIRSEGFFVDNWIDHIDLDSVETLQKLEQEIGREIERQATKIIKKMQTEFYADIFKLHEEVRINDFSHWQQVKENWDGKDGAFSKAEINIETQVEIRHYMTNEELEERR